MEELIQVQIRDGVEDVTYISTTLTKEERIYMISLLKKKNYFFLVC